MTLIKTADLRYLDVISHIQTYKQYRFGNIQKEMHAFNIHLQLELFSQRFRVHYADLLLIAVFHDEDFETNDKYSNFHKCPYLGDSFGWFRG